MPAFPWVLGALAISVTGPRPQAPSSDPGGVAPVSASAVPGESSGAGAPELSGVEPENEGICAQRVVQSCRAALGETECVLAAEGETAEWEAEVHVLPDGVGVTLKHDQFERTRSLSFAPVDTEEQRCVAAGLLVAAMTAAARLDAAPPLAVSQSSPEVESPVLAQEEPKHSVVRKKAPALSLDVGTALLTMLRHEDLGMGALWRVTGWPFCRGQMVSWGISGQVLGARDVGKNGFDVGLFEGGIGLAVLVLPATLPLGVRLHADALMTRTWVAGVPETTGSQAANQGGGALSGLLFLSRSEFSPWIGLRAGLAFPHLEIQREGATLVQASLSRFSVGIGATWQPRGSPW